MGKLTKEGMREQAATSPKYRTSDTSAHLDLPLHTAGFGGHSKLSALPCAEKPSHNIWYEHLVRMSTFAKSPKWTAKASMSCAVYQPEPAREAMTSQYCSSALAP